MARSYTVNNPVAATRALREISAGHEKAATAILSAASLDGLGNDRLRTRVPGSAWRPTSYRIEATKGVETCASRKRA